jgi:hypothetical protein
VKKIVAHVESGQKTSKNISVQTKKGNQETAALSDGTRQSLEIKENNG